MSKLSPYVNEIISFVVMLLLLVALVSSQLGNPALQLAGASDDNAETTHIRLEGEESSDGAFAPGLLSGAFLSRNL